MPRSPAKSLASTAASPPDTSSAPQLEQAQFDALTSAEKTLHANPGQHAEVPAFEVDSALRFFARQLG
jgi:hypothetical protein